MQRSEVEKGLSRVREGEMEGGERARLARWGVETMEREGSQVPLAVQVLQALAMRGELFREREWLRRVRRLCDRTGRRYESLAAAAFDILLRCPELPPGMLPSLVGRFGRREEEMAKLATHSSGDLALWKALLGVSRSPGQRRSGGSRQGVERHRVLDALAWNPRSWREAEVGALLRERMQGEAEVFLAFCRHGASAEELRQCYPRLVEQNPRGAVEVLESRGEEAHLFEPLALQPLLAVEDAEIRLRVIRALGTRGKAHL